MGVIRVVHRAGTGLAALALAGCLATGGPAAPAKADPADLLARNPRLQSIDDLVAVLEGAGAQVQRSADGGATQVTYSTRSRGAVASRRLEQVCAALRGPAAFNKTSNLLSQPLYYVYEPGGPMVDFSSDLAKAMAGFEPGAPARKVVAAMTAQSQAGICPHYQADPDLAPEVRERTLHPHFVSYESCEVAASTNTCRLVVLKPESVLPAVRSLVRSTRSQTLADRERGQREMARQHEQREREALQEEERRRQLIPAMKVVGTRLCRSFPGSLSQYQGVVVLGTPYFKDVPGIIHLSGYTEGHSGERLQIRVAGMAFEGAQRVQLDRLLYNADQLSPNFVFWDDARLWAPC